MEVVLFWIGFSVVIGILANQRGRGAVGWGILAALISPILSGIILFIIPDLKKINDEKRQKEKLEQAEKDKQMLESSKVKGSDLLLSFEKLHQLFEKEVLNEAEFTARKKKKIEELNKNIIDDSAEDFLSALVPLIENNTLTKEEMNKIKSIVYDDEI